MLDQGLDENPEKEIDPVVGSGPMQIADFQSRNILALEPAEQERPVFNPDHNLTYQVFQSGEP